MEVFRESSGVLADALRKHYQADVIVLLGTGAITLAKGDRGTFVADGWGADIGDAGSGYWIGLEAIKRSLTALEGDGPLPALAQKITGRTSPLLSTNDSTELMKLRDHVRNTIGLPLERARVAALAKTASTYANAGDEMAMGIFHDAGVSLAETVIRAVKRCGCPEALHMPLMTRHRYGKGQAWYLTWQAFASYQMAGGIASVRKLVLDILQEADVKPFVRLGERDLLPSPGITACKQTLPDGRWLLTFVNGSYETAPIEACAEAAAKADILLGDCPYETERSEKGLQISLCLKPWESVMLLMA